MPGQGTEGSHATADRPIDIDHSSDEPGLAALPAEGAASSRQRLPGDATGEDVIRQIFLGSTTALGVTVLGHTMSIGQEVAVVGVLSAILLGLAVAAFDRQE